MNINIITNNFMYFYSRNKIPIVLATVNSVNYRVPIFTNIIHYS